MLHVGQTSSAWMLPLSKSALGLTSSVTGVHWLSNLPRSARSALPKEWQSQGTAKTDGVGGEALNTNAFVGA